jgi:hypothetical protein
VKLNGHPAWSFSTAQSAEKESIERSVKWSSLLIFAEVGIYFDACTLMLC